MSDVPPQELIRAKRDGRSLTEDEITDFVDGLTDGTIGEGQVAAMAMAIFFRGLNDQESAALTRAMMRSGCVIDWSHLDRPVLDKHSTGGVGDKVSLMLAPIMATCGAAVPMISGRGLGHTGGTIDKLEAIPGYSSTPDIETFQRVVAEVGCAIVGQTGDLAPADGRLYAIRDVTATVESIPLITASILSKKLAAGLDGLVMDVKVGNGAFMQEPADARALAESLVSVAMHANLPTRAVITDMNQVLGTTAGNALEVAEAVNYLAGAVREPRLDTVVRTLCRELLLLGEAAKNAEAADAMVLRALDTGTAAEVFERMVAALDGPGDFLSSHARHLVSAPVVVAATAERAGFVTAIDTRAVGLAVLALGGGRTRADQAIDHAVGLTDVVGLGAEVDAKRPLARVHARSEHDGDRAVAALRAAVSLSDDPPVPGSVIHQRL